MNFRFLLLVPILGLMSISESLAWFPPAQCFFPDATHVRAPDWICQQNSDSELITALGVEPTSASGVSFSRNMAIANARINLAKRVHAQCNMGEFREVVLKNSRLLNTQTSPRGTQYAQVGIRPVDLRFSCR